MLFRSAARYLLSALPEHQGADPQERKATLTQALFTCEETGILGMAHCKDGFSISVRNAYRHFLFTVHLLNHFLEINDQRTIATVDLIAGLRSTLMDLIDAADVEANTTSQRLMDHP